MCFFSRLNEGCGNSAPQKARWTSDALEAKPLSEITSRPGRSVARRGSRFDIVGSAACSAGLGFGGAHGATPASTCRRRHRRPGTSAGPEGYTMTSFLTHRARVHDAGLPLCRRHSALRTCITLFAPYGFRATYHHLTLSAAIPRRLEADPDALVRAVEELHEARMLWLARVEEYAAQRRAEKRAGRRAVPNPRPWWLRSRWDGPDRAWHEDPSRHPSLRLSEYVRRQHAPGEGLSLAPRLPGCHRASSPWCSFLIRVTCPRLSDRYRGSSHST